MLRLLPDRLYVGLFEEHPWLALGAAGGPVPVMVPTNGTAADILDAILHSSSHGRRPRKLSVMLSGQSALCTNLPWSPALRGQEEQHAYALAHLEKAGLGTSENYAVHAEFRHYGAQGLAYAVPMKLLDALRAVAARHQLDLTTVLPVSAVAHLAASRARNAGRAVSLVVDGTSISALSMDRAGLQSYDAEPVVGRVPATLRRLLARMAADGTELNSIRLCSHSDDEELARIAGEFAGKISVHKVKPSDWRRFL